MIFYILKKYQVIGFIYMKYTLQSKYVELYNILEEINNKK